MILPFHTSVLVAMEFCWTENKEVLTLKARALLLGFVLDFDCKRRNYLQVQNT